MLNVICHLYLLTLTVLLDLVAVLDAMNNSDNHLKEIHLAVDTFSYVIYLLKNRPTVKKGAALFKMASVKEVVKSKGAAKKWL